MAVNLVTRVTLMLFWGSFFLQVQAEPWKRGFSLQLAHEYDNNITRSETKTVNQAERLGAQLDLDKRSSSLVTEVHLGAQHDFNSDIEDITSFNGYAQTEASFLPERLSWIVQDVMLQTRIDPLVPLSATNSLNTNTFSTGPVWRWQITNLDKLNLTARAERINYDQSDFIDRERWQAEGQWQHQLNRLWQLGLGYELIKENLFDQADLELKTLSASIQRATSRAQLTGSVGKTDVQNVNERQTIGNIAWRYQLNKSLHVWADYRRSISSDIEARLNTVNQLQSDALFLDGNGVDRNGLSGNTLPQDITDSLSNQFGFDNALLKSTESRMAVDWAWDQRKLRVLFSQRETQDFFPGANGVVIVGDQQITDEMILSLLNPLGARWWLETRLAQLQTELATQAISSNLDQQSISIALAYRLSRSLTVSQNVFFEHADQGLADLNATDQLSNFDTFRYLLSLDWVL